MYTKNIYKIACAAIPEEKKVSASFQNFFLAFCKCEKKIIIISTFELNFLS